MSEFRILTRYLAHHGSNVGKVLATSLGRQATIRWDQSLSADANHHNAAVALAERLASLGMEVTVGDEVRSNDAGTMRQFAARMEVPR